MEYWKDEKEPIDFFVKLFEEGFKDEELSGGLRKVNQLILFDLIDCPVIPKP